MTVMVDLPPAKHASDYTLEERRAIVAEARKATEEVVAYLKRLAELDAEIEGASDGGDGGPRSS